MISAASVREQKVVQTADTTPLSQRYGYKTAATPDQLRAAKQFVEGLVGSFESTIDEHFVRLRDIGENPYRDNIPTGYYDNDGVKYGTKIPIATGDALKKLHGKHFTGENGGEAAPDLNTLFKTAIDELSGMYRTAGFDVLGPYRRPNDTEGDFLVLRDPEYVKARDAFVEAKRANDLGAARDQKWFRRLLLALRIAKPHQPLALPAPGPKAPIALPAPAAPVAEASQVAKAVPPVALVDTGIEPQPAVAAREAGGFSIAQ